MKVYCISCCHIFEKDKKTGAESVPLTNTGRDWMLWLVKRDLCIVCKDKMEEINKIVRETVLELSERYWRNKEGEKK